MISRADCEALDADDPLAFARDRFELPEGVIYLDGNSLGALPRSTAARLTEVVRDEWGRGLIRSWNDAQWMELPHTVGDAVGALIGAEPGDVVTAESTTIALYKAIGAALELQRSRRPGRRVVVTETGNFPTDAHVLGEFARRGEIEVRAVDADDVCGAIGSDVALVVLTHVNYRTGDLHDMAAVTAAAHAAGALIVWDLAHSAGAVPVALRADDVDLAVGCGYKFLNGGPGAPAFLYAAERLRGELRNPLPGWLGHADPFSMSERHEPAAGIGAFVSGTPPVLGLSALAEGVRTFDGCSMVDLYAKARRLVELFDTLVSERLPHAGLVAAQQTAVGGSQYSVRHPEAFAIVQALVARGVIGDFREPDIARFGIAPLYVRAVDIWDAVDHLAAVFDGQEYARPEFQVRGAVT